MADPRSEIKRINGYLREVVTLFDDSGKQMSQIINPIMVELLPRDVLQIVVGSFLVGSPLCFTEEVWNLSVELSLVRVKVLAIVSLVMVTSFVYFNFYRFKLKGNVFEFVKRIIATYGIALATVASTLYLIDKFPWAHDPVLATKRTILIGFPAVLGATLSDYIK